MRFMVLGALEVDGPDGPVELSPKLRDLLAILLCAPNRAVPACRLIDGLWDGTPPPSAPTTLRGYICHLRRALGGDRLPSRPSGYVLLIRDGDLDADRFARLAEDGRRAIAAGVKVAMGSDAAGAAHGSNLGELAEMSALGMSPVDVLRSATSSAAELLQRDDIGRVGIGRRANLTMVSGDPFEFDAYPSNVRAVFKRGRLVRDYRAATAP